MTYCTTCETETDIVQSSEMARCAMCGDSEGLQEITIKNTMEKYINSGNIHKITWSSDTLRIYSNTGQIVAYINIPEGIAVGMAHAPSPGSYFNRYIRSKYTHKIEKHGSLTEKNKCLEHHKDTTVGLWATDKPELIPDDLKGFFFEIMYDDINGESL